MWTKALRKSNFTAPNGLEPTGLRCALPNESSDTADKVVGLLLIIENAA